MFLSILFTFELTLYNKQVKSNECHNMHHHYVRHLHKHQCYKRSLRPWCQYNSAYNCTILVYCFQLKQFVDNERAIERKKNEERERE